MRRPGCEKEKIMSNWTHVAGIIRIDEIRLDERTPDFDKIIGKECLFESSRDVWHDCNKHPEKYLPMGSEGSLHKSVWINPNRNAVAAYTVSVFGDLRDHDDPREIIDWFKDKCAGVNARNAVITVVNELNGSITWTLGDS